MAETFTEVIDQIKESLIQRKINLLGPCGAFAITSRFAWRFRGMGIGLVHKRPEQNGCVDSIREEKYGVDVIMFKDGSWADILEAAEAPKDGAAPLPDGSNYNIPSWQFHNDGIDASLWREPFNPDLTYDLSLNDPPKQELDRPTNPDTILDLIKLQSDRIDALRKDFSRLQDDILRIENKLDRRLVGKVLGMTVVLAPERTKKKEG